MPITRQVTERLGEISRPSTSASVDQSIRLRSSGTQTIDRLAPARSTLLNRGLANSTAVPIRGDQASRDGLFPSALRDYRDVDSNCRDSLVILRTPPMQRRRHGWIDLGLLPGVFPLFDPPFAHLRTPERGS